MSSPQQNHQDALLIAKEHSIGYPCNYAYDYTDVFPSFKYNYNNVGDPSIPSLYQIHSKDEELQVLAFFEQLWQFDPQNAWGYITHSGTEGNMQGLYVGRQVFPDAILYCTEESHYSIFKIASILRLETIVIPSRENGEMDYTLFEQKLDKTRPALICANLGTTMKGAIDNPREIYRILRKHDMHNRYYMHADGALMGFVLPFLELDIFFKKSLHSISISGHKFLGCPFPCGVFMMEKRFLDLITHPVEYIGSNDNTISGSRNGHSAIFLSHIIKNKGFDGFRKDIFQCIDNSEFLINSLQDKNVNAWRNNNSFTIVIPRPEDSIVKKWQLPVHKTISHVITMPHVTRPKLNAFVKEFKMIQ